MSTSTDQDSAAGDNARAYGLIVELPRAESDQLELRFISARIAQRVVPRPVVSSLPTGQLGICLVDGLILPVIDLGPAATELIICELPRPHPGQRGYLAGAASGSETLAISGARVLVSGAFKRHGGAVEHAGQQVEALDLDLLEEPPTLSTRQS